MTKSDTEKTTLTLQGGEVIDCGVLEKQELLDALSEQNPRRITKSTVGLLLSSDKMMSKISNNLKEFVKMQKKRKREKKRQKTLTGK